MTKSIKVIYLNENIINEDYYHAWIRAKSPLKVLRIYFLESWKLSRIAIKNIQGPNTVLYLGDLPRFTKISRFYR